MTTTPTIDELAAAVANIRANIARQARTGRAVLLTAEDANALLDYLDELETDRNGWRSVAGVRQERIVELERNGVVDNNEV